MRLSIQHAIALALVTLLIAAGCRPDHAPEPTPVTPDEDVAADTALVAEEMPDESVSAETAIVQQRELTIEDVRRYGRAAESIHEVVAQDPDLRRIQDELDARMDDAGSIREVETLLDEHPQIREAIQEAGFSTEDYLATGAALYGAYMYVTMREQGVPDAYRPDYVTDEHVRFVEQNRAEVEAVITRIMEVYGADMDP